MVAVHCRVFAQLDLSARQDFRRGRASGAMRYGRSDSRCRTELSKWGQRVFLTAHFQITRVISLAPAGNAADSHEYAIYLVGGHTMKRPS